MIETERLILRTWQDTDLEPFAAMNADPDVMRHFPRCMTREESDAAVERFREHHATHGFGMYAVEVKDGPGFVGFVGLAHLAYDAHFTPAVEIGWRLSPLSWGKGYASEAARACLEQGFGAFDLDEIVAIAPQVNTPSIAVMERIGMHRVEGGDFQHPYLEPDSPLQPCALYRARRDEFAGS